MLHKLDTLLHITGVNMCKVVKFCVENARNLVVICSIVIATTVFLARLAPRITELETKVSQLETKLDETERNFSLTSTKLETTLSQISADLQIIKQHILVRGK